MDERADRGEFYPGGREGGVPPGTDTDKVDRVNLGELGESYTLKEVKAKVNQIVRAIAPAVACLALCAQAATGVLEDLPNTAPVVTNEEDAVAMAAVGALGGAVSNKVDVEVAGVHARIDSATNALTVQMAELRSADSNRIEATYAKLADIPAQPDLSPYALKSELPQDYLGESDITNFATRAWINSQNYAREGTVYTRLDAQDLAIDAATNWLWAAHLAEAARLNAASNAITRDFRLQIEDLRLGTNALSSNLQSSILNLQSAMANGMNAMSVALSATSNNLQSSILNLQSATASGTNRLWLAMASASNRVTAATNALARDFRLQIEDLRLGTNALRVALSATSNNLQSSILNLQSSTDSGTNRLWLDMASGTNRLWQTVRSESNRLDSATNKVWQSALRADEALQSEIDALRIVAADSNAVTRLVTADGSTWQDATGVVWQVTEIYGWGGTALDLTNTTERPVQFNPVPGTNEVWSAGVGTNLVYDAIGMSSYCIIIEGVYYYADDYPPQSATNITITTQYDKYDLYYGVVAQSTNPVDRVLYEQSPVLRDIIAEQATGTVARALTYGTPTRWTDATGCVWEVEYTRICTSMNEEWTYTMDGQTYTREQMIEAAGGDEVYSMILDWEDSTFINKDADNEEFEGWYVLDGSGTVPVGYDYSTGVIPSYASDPYLAQVTYYGDITATRGELVLVTNLVGRVAFTNDIPEIDTSEFASHLDATNAAKSVVNPVSNLVETVRAEASLVYRLYQGSNVVAEVTNYNSQVHAPELRIMQLNESNEYITVWAETNGLARTLVSAKEYTDGATGAVVQAVAPRAWSKVTAGLGFEAPSNTTWLSTGRTVIAGGLEYEKHMTSGGAIWLLESNGMTADFHAQTNNTAFIDLSNADGTPIFRVEKTDGFLVGVHVDNVTVDGDTLVCGVGVVAADHPLVRVKAQLESGEWAKEEDGIPASLATVTWSGTTGNWTCRIQNNTGGNTLFAQMEYFQEGGTKIVNSAALDVSEGILCTDGIHKCRPVYSSAGGGTITWEVVQ